MLGLVTPTAPAWAELAADHLPTLLVDHAHCELKAASNAMTLIPRCALNGLDVTRLAELAEEETRHFRAVMAELGRRGLGLGAPEVCTYADRLRHELRHRPSASASSVSVLVDRLHCAALIEARSCERFKLLAEALRRRGDPLAAFYDDLLASEARHHVLFVELAAAAIGDEDVARARLAEARAIEGRVAASLGARPTVHG